MESKKQTGLTSKIETDSYTDSRLTAGGGGRGEVRGLEGSSKKENRLSDMDNRVVTVGGGGYKGDK